MEEERKEKNAGQEWLHFVYKEGRTRTPVKISRTALKRCFRSTTGQSLVSIYVAHTEAIHEKVRARLRAGERFTQDRPLELLECDFGDLRLAVLARSYAGEMSEEAALQLLEEMVNSEGPDGSSAGNYIDWRPGHANVKMLGTFTAEQLEAVAAWMRVRASSEESLAGCAPQGTPPARETNAQSALSVSSSSSSSSLSSSARRTVTKFEASSTKDMSFSSGAMPRTSV